jgi:L-alanine-DL-glutamate epimerase-like enolase superfamily enzyme
MARITAVRARSVAVPLRVVTSLSSRDVTARHYGLVEVEGDDGAMGVGFCYVGSAGGTLFPEIVANLLAPVVVGADAHGVEGLWERMYQEALLQGRAGTVMRAISAVDIALWDRNARAAGLPLYKFLGACREGAVPAYASGGYYVEGKTPLMLADEAAGFVADGFSALKIKVGRDPDPGREEERLAAVRDRVGPDVIVMLDANNAWRDLPTALRVLRRFERYDPYFIEEPFGPDEIALHARLARATPIPVVTGEIEAGRWRFKDLLDREAAAILQTDACVCGGISEFRRIAATAASYGVTLAPHWFHDVHAHLVAATPNCRYVEFFPNSDVLNFRDLVDVQLVAERGRLLLPDRPGLGLNFRADQVERYATSPWR